MPRLILLTACIVVAELLLPTHELAAVVFEPIPPDPLAEEAKWEAQLDQTIASIEIRGPINIKTFLTSVLQGTSGFKFHLSEDVEGTVELSLAEVTLRDLLDTVLTPKGFTWKRERDTILVSLQPQLETRVFPLTAEELKWVQYLLDHPELTDYPQLDSSVERNCDPEADTDPRLCLNQEKRTLVVHNTDENIGKVEAWLAKLEETIDVTSRSTALPPWIFTETQDEAQQLREEEPRPEESGQYRTHIFSLSPESFDRVKRILEQLDATGIAEMELRRIIFGERDPEAIPGRELRLNENTQTLIVRDIGENIAEAAGWLASLEDIVTGDGLVYWSTTLDPETAAQAYELLRRYLVEEVGGGEEAYQEAGKQVSLDEKTGVLIVLDTLENIEAAKSILAREISQSLSRPVLEARVFTVTENKDTDPESVKDRLQLTKQVVDELRILLYEGSKEAEEEANQKGRRIFYPENEEQEQRDPRFKGTITVVDTKENLQRVPGILAELGISVPQSGEGGANDSDWKMRRVYALRKDDVKELDRALPPSSVATWGFDYDSERGLLTVRGKPENIETVEKTIVRSGLAAKMRNDTLRAKEFRVTDNVGTDEHSVKRRMDTVHRLVDDLRLILYGGDSRAEAKAAAEGRRIFFPRDRLWEATSPRSRGIITVVDTRENLRRVEEYLERPPRKITVELRLLLIADSALDEWLPSGDQTVFSPAQLIDFLNMASRRDEAEVISAPKVVTISGLPRTVEIYPDATVSEIDLSARVDDDPVAPPTLKDVPLHALEPAGDGLYRLVETPLDESPGIIMSATPTIVSEQIFLDARVEARVMRGREPLPGAPDIEAGKPVLERKILTITRKLQNNGAVLLRLSSERDFRGTEIATIMIMTVLVAKPDAGLSPSIPEPDFSAPLEESDSSDRLTSEHYEVTPFDIVK